jgi:hypothetical protein
MERIVANIDIKSNSFDEDERDLMDTAIKTLARVTITQTKKFILYRRKYFMAKGAVIEESDRTKLAEEEKEKAKNAFYDARAQYLKEKDIREELSEEVQYLAKKNNKLRKENNIKLEAQQSTLDEIINTWEEYAEIADINSTHGSNPLSSISQSTEGESTHEIESTRIKELENMVSVLQLQLTTRDKHLDCIKRQITKNETF